MKLAFVASPTPQAQEALHELELRYGAMSVEEADAIVVLGGDGHVLKTLHATLDKGKGIYALRRTQSVGFLCNDYDTENLLERVARAQRVDLHPMRVACMCTDGTQHMAVAINEVTLLRDSPQSAKLRVSVDGIERLARFSGDGLLVSTPAGSTAYNHSAGGPIMPLDSNTLVMTAICGFRPRRWSYAVLPQDVQIDVAALELEKRPIRVEAGFASIHNVASAHICLDKTITFTLLFDPEKHLGERIIQEQFMA